MSLKDKKKISKINTINYGRKWIGLGFIFAVVIPGIIWLIKATLKFLIKGICTSFLQSN